MAENTTTLLEKWQKQEREHPEWTPSLEDLLYFIHGTGSDRDRLYSVEELRDFLQTVITALTGLKNISISYSSSNDRISITGSSGSIYIEGGNPPKIRFVSSQGGPSSELTHNGLKLVDSSGTQSEKQALQSLDGDGNFTADKSYVLESSQATPRQFKVKSSGGAFSFVDYDKLRSLNGGGYTDVTPSGVSIHDNNGNSGSIGYDSASDAVSFGKPPKSSEYLIGSQCKLKSTVGTDGPSISIEMYENNHWVTKAVIRSGGKELLVKAQLSYDPSNWIYEGQDVDFSGQGTGASHDLSTYKENAPFAIFNTNAYGTTSITVIDNTGNRTYEIAAGCARWFVKTRVNGTVTLFAFGGDAW
jgi:hypothetical protein